MYDSYQYRGVKKADCSKSSNDSLNNEEKGFIFTG